MEVYEIRIIKSGQRSAEIYSSSHIGDYAAIRRALNLAPENSLIEVWSGMRCLYSGAAELAPDPELQKREDAPGGYGLSSAET